MATRLLNDSFTSSPSIAECSPRAQDAFPRFLLHADDFGCFDANPKIIKGARWALRDDVSPGDIREWLVEYAQAGMARIWFEGDRWWGFLTGFHGPHGQRPREEYSEQNKKGSRRHTPKPPEVQGDIEAYARGLVPAVSRAGNGGKSDFPRLQSQVQEQEQLEREPRAIAVPPGRGPEPVATPVVIHEDESSPQRRERIARVANAPRYGPFAPAYELAFGRLLGGEHRLVVDDWLDRGVPPERLTEALGVAVDAKKRGVPIRNTWGAFAALVDGTPVGAPFSWQEAMPEAGSRGIAHARAAAQARDPSRGRAPVGDFSGAKTPDPKEAFR